MTVHGVFYTEGVPAHNTRKGLCWPILQKLTVKIEALNDKKGRSFHFDSPNGKKTRAKLKIRGLNSPDLYTFHPFFGRK
jgi:hypothetical protein